jgi:subtilisin-like proprotein convertase family protein
MPTEGMRATRLVVGGLMGKTLPRQTPVMAVALLAAMLGAVVALGLAASAASAATFSNDDGITINDGSENCTGGTRTTEPGSATPYPSEIEVSDLGSSTSISDVNVTVSGLSHPFPEDVGLLLESPGGQRTLLMTDSGGGTPGVSGINLTFDDAASGTIPPTGGLESGTYRPTEGTTTANCSAPLSFPDPAPARPYSSSLSVFNSTNPNGIWKLYVIDDTLRDVGSISGWSLDISVDTTAPSVTINQASSQADPTTDSPIHFTAVFNEPVTGFIDSDVTLSGTAGATTAVVSEAAPNDGTTYDVAVSGMSSDGTVIASIPANAAQDAAQNGNSASTSTDNTVTFIVEEPDTRAPKVIRTFPRNGGEVGPARDVTATFSEDMLEASVMNAFKLFRKGSTNQIDAVVTYNAATDTATLNPTNNLRRGATYKAVVTTVAKDKAGNRLDQNSSAAGLQQKVWFFEIDN